MSYPKVSLSFRDKIVQSSVECMDMIRELDAETEKISLVLDDLIQAAGDKPTDNQLEEMIAIRKAIEFLTTKKIELATNNYDILDNNIKAIDFEMDLMEKAILQVSDEKNLESFNDIIESLKRKREDEVSKSSLEIEPLYCLCKQVAFGEMVACDNEDCPIEWFHYPCVNLTRKPRNSWVCPICSSKKKK